MLMHTPPRVLMIDDSRLVHRFLDDALVDEDLEHLHAYDADEGIAAAIEALPDLILLDVELATSSGFEVCQALKNDARTTQIPIIFLSGAGDIFNKVQGLDLGAVDYIVKPFDLAELQARVRTALRTKRLVDLLSERAAVDAVTGLQNRLYFNRCLQDELDRSVKTGAVVSLLMLDIDHFKRCNDSYGHPFGDRVLQTIAETVKSTLRKSDIACRYGGEEFGIILPETGLDDAMTVAERVRARIEDCVLVHRGITVKVTVSGGLACSSALPDAEAKTIAALIDQADFALYEAKSSGRNQIVLAAQSLIDEKAGVCFLSNRRKTAAAAKELTQVTLTAH